MSENHLKIYKQYMKRALNLAKKGAGHVSPNPMVGAVLLDKNLKFISEGFHKKYGEAHAEVNAINAAILAGKDIKDGTIVVTLEPCSHHGKTPPCADLIIKSGIKTVVVGCLDPNTKVSGQGIEKCKKAGLTVITGILENECKKVNEIFFKNQLEESSFIAIKTAITIDGKIAAKNGSSKWITGEKSRDSVQKLRNFYEAILTSSNTVIADNPSLTCRTKNGRNPIRIIVDSNLRTSPASKVYAADGTRTIIATTLKNNNKYPSHVEVMTLPSKNGHVDLKALTATLYKENIFSVLVEAGGTLNGEFLKSNLIDKLFVYTAPKILADSDGISFASGYKAKDINDVTNLELVSIKKYGQDIMSEYNVKKSQ